MFLCTGQTLKSPGVVRDIKPLGLANVSLKRVVTVACKGSSSREKKCTFEAKMQCTVFYWFVWVVSVCLVAAIEVHENPNEENTTTDSGMLKSTLPNSSVVAMVGSGANNEPGKQHVTASGTPASNGGNSEDYTIVPSNHKPATNNNQPKHSPSYRDAPLSITPTVSSLASSTSSSPQSASAVATQSSSSGSSSKKYVTHTRFGAIICWLVSF